MSLTMADGTLAFRPMAPSVPLSQLVEFAVQRTYHELQILADLLPRKTDMERKIEIVNFSNRTRQTFVRLLALVKWAGSASKVEKCSTIINFLDKQSLLFTDTADVLAKMARETLVQARLPTFQIPAAVEVLTLGTYSRLPTCIREKIVPPDPITTGEKRLTLLRLNQIIQQRLVTSVLPDQMKNLHVENGRVTFIVPNEFELSLTLLGDGNNIPWKVLNLRILVIDRDSIEASAITAGSSKDLVHPMQNVFLQDLVQSRLVDNSRPLIDAYNVLHSFCLSLQLEVLNLQVYRLIRERLKDYIRVEEYAPGKKLSVYYWREYCLTNKLPIPAMKLSLEIDTQDSSKPLQIYHTPELNENEATPIANLKSSMALSELSSYSSGSNMLENLSFEKMFIHATHERAKSLLTQLQNELTSLRMGLKVSLSGCPPILEVSYLEPCAASEKLIVSVDTLTGFFLAHVPQFTDDCLLTTKFPTTLRDVSKIGPWINDLRVWIFKQRCRRTVEFLPVDVHETLPFIPGYTHKIAQSKVPRLFFNFCKHNLYFLMASFITPSDESNTVEIEYNLLSVKYVSFESASEASNNSSSASSSSTGNNSNNTSSNPTNESDLPKVFVKLCSKYKIDIASLTNRYIDSHNFDESESGKRKRAIEPFDSTNKKLKNTGFFISELAHVISFCDDKFFNSSLSLELNRKNICHQIRVNVHPANSHYIDLVQFPPQNLFPPSQLQKDLLTATIRFSNKVTKYWTVTLSFYNCPIQSTSPKENGARKSVYLMYDFTNDAKGQMSQMVNEMLNDWSAIEKLYDVVCAFGKVAHLYSSLIEIRSFTYKKLSIGYGANKSYSVSIHWKSAEKRFHLTFGVCGILGGTNPHTIVSTQLQNEFNQHRDIATLVQTLESTIEPLASILGLNTVTQLATVTSKPFVPTNSFSWIPQTSTHLRLLFRGLFCIDVIVQSDGLISVRDGACTVLDKVKAEELTIIPSLKAFLNRYVDRSVSQLRRPSQADDDNPPSPHIDGNNSADQYSFANASASMRNASPAVGGVDGSSSGAMSNAAIRSTHMGSNPNTPASPQTSMFSQMAYGASPGSAFPLAASPHTSVSGHHGMAAPSPSLPSSHSMADQSPALFSVNSPANQMHAPSPGFLPTPSPGPQLQSPAPSFLHGSHDHSQQVNSPFHTSSVSMHSPAPGWLPGSPSISRPSPGRPLSQVQSPGSCGQPLPLGQSPQTPNSMHTSAVQQGPVSGSYGTPGARAQIPVKSHIYAIPTIMTAKGFHQMCKPGPMTEMVMTSSNPLSQSISPLERFLGCVFLRRQFASLVSKSEGITMLNPTESGIVSFKMECFQFKLSLHPTTMQSLHLNISVFEQFRNQWSQEEISTIERFIESKVLCAPYKPNGINSVIRLLSQPIDLIKDCIQLMRIEMHTDRSLNWAIQFNLTMPSLSFMPNNAGMSAFVRLNKSLILFCLQFTRINHHPNSPANPHEAISYAVPFVYDMSNRTLKTACREGLRPPFIHKINGIITQFYATHPQGVECTLAAVIHEIMRHD